MNNTFDLTGISMLLVLAMLTACGSDGGDGARAPSASSASPSSSATATPSSKVLASDTDTTELPPGTELLETFPNLGRLRTESDPVMGMADDFKWWVEQRFPGRASVVDVGRDGSPGLRLHTEAGDDNVTGSGSAERSDVAFQNTDGVQGREQWWAHSVLFPDDFAIPPMDYSWTVIFDFHNSANQGGQANFHIFVTREGLTFRGHGGPEVVYNSIGNEYSYGADIGPLKRNVWYDFVYHVKWSAYSDGFFQAWVNGALVLDHYGPTLYEDQRVFLKLANYHSAFGQPSSVIHDRVVRGTNWRAVSLTALEGIEP